MEYYFIFSTNSLIILSYNIKVGREVITVEENKAGHVQYKDKPKAWETKTNLCGLKNGDTTPHHSLC